MEQADLERKIIRKYNIKYETDISLTEESILRRRTSLILFLSMPLVVLLTKNPYKFSLHFNFLIWIKGTKPDTLSQIK